MWGEQKINICKPKKYFYVPFTLAQFAQLHTR